MCQNLMEIGIAPRKSLICRMPNIDKKLVRHFIRGIFDGMVVYHIIREKKEIRYPGLSIYMGVSSFFFY